MEKQCEKNWYYKIINDETNEVECYTKASVHIKAEKLCELIVIEGCHAVEITEDEYKEESKMSDNLKYDDNKPRLDLVPPELIEAVGIVRTYGVSKYGDSESWKQVEPYRYRAALMRHICLYLEEPDGVDAESGLPHLWHIACNVAFLIALNAEKRPTSGFTD